MKLKRMLTLFLAVLLVASSSLFLCAHALYVIYNTPAIVSQGTNGYAQGKSTSGYTCIVNLFRAPKIGDTLIMGINQNINDIEYLSSISESGTTWYIAANYTYGENYAAFVCYAYINGTTGTRINITFTGDTIYGVSADVCEWSGILSTSPVDRNATNYGSAFTADTGTTATTRQTREVFVGVIATGASYAQTLSSASVTNGYTMLDGRPSSGLLSHESLAYIYKVASGEETADAGTTSSNTLWAGCIATFYASPISTTSAGSTTSPSTNPTPTHTSTPITQPTLSPTSTVPEFPTLILPLFATMIFLSILFTRKRILNK